MEIPLLELEIFSVPPVQQSVERDVVTEHRPTDALSSNGNIRFEFSLGSNEYLLFSESYLYVRGKVSLNKDVPVDTDWEKVFPANYFLHSLFSQVNLTINGETVTNSTQNYMYEAYIEATLGYSKHARNSQLSGSLWNEKKAARNKTICKGGEFDLMGRLHLDFTHQPRALIGGCKDEIILTRNKNNFLFECADDKLAPEFQLGDIVLEVHRQVVSAPVVAAQNRALNISAAKYPITRSVVKNIRVNSGTIDTTLENVFCGQLPRRLFFMMVKNTAYNGDVKANPYLFNHYNLTYFTCYLDGQQFPSRAYQPDFERGLCAREYLGLLQALNQNGTDSYSNITFEEFKKDKMILGVNFAPDLSNGFGATGHLSPIKAGVIRIQLRFAKPLEETISVLVYGEFDSIIEIDKGRNVSCNYIR